MATRKLSGMKINEGEELAGACFYDGTTGRAFGPVFEDAEQAESFLSFLRGLDPLELGWDEPIGTGDVLFHIWLKEGKPEQRACPQLDYTWFTHHEAEEDESEHWSFVCDVSGETLFPLFLGYDCYEISSLLIKHGVAQEEQLNPERSCLWARFSTEDEAKGFIDKLNGFLRDNWHRAYST